MNHLDAEKEYLAEGYALGQLDTSEREAFELHMASCSICAEETLLAMIFLESLTEALQEDAKLPPNDEDQKNRCRVFLRRHRQRSE